MSQGPARHFAKDVSALVLGQAMPDEKQEYGRRRFVAWGLWTILGIIAASSVWPVVELVSRRTAGKRLVWFRAAVLDEMPEVGVKKFELNLRGGGRPDARVFIRRDADGTLTAFSAVCTHLGCIVNYNHLKREFICPCHAGRYDTSGKVISGPPPAPLMRLPVRLQERDIQVGLMV